MCTLHKGPPGWIGSERIAWNRGLVWPAWSDLLSEWGDKSAPSTTKSRPKLMSNRLLHGEGQERRGRGETRRPTAATEH